MQLDTAKVARLEAFLSRIERETYPESPSQLHDELIVKMIGYFQGKVSLPSTARILDVGCGQGTALRQFRKTGLGQPVGIVLNEEDFNVCKQQGHEVHYMDQSFLDFDDQSFDLVWCRHCLEHSVFPLFTLSEFGRVVRPGGYLYVEVPAPDTSCHHETNPNHYSVLGKSMWADLIKRAGFSLLDMVDISFTVMAGPDMYWAFISQKK